MLIFLVVGGSQAAESGRHENEVRREKGMDVREWVGQPAHRITKM